MCAIKVIVYLTSPMKPLPSHISFLKAAMALAFAILLLLGVGRVQASGDELVTNGDFANGINGWKVESGKGVVVDGHLLIATDQHGQGVVSQTIAVKPNTEYRLGVDFHFEPGIDDAWCSGTVEVWAAGTSVEEADRSRCLGEFVFKTRKAEENGYENGEWRTGNLTFNSGDNTEVILRLRSHPDSTDQTHWNKISIK